MAAGNVVAQYIYWPYGNLQGSWNNGSMDTPFRYAGQYTDSESGLIYLRARFYDPQSRQFLSVDPLVAATGQPYGYVAGNPLNVADPDGDWPNVALGSIPSCISQGGGVLGALDSVGSCAKDAASEVNNALPTVHSVAGVVALTAGSCAVVLSETVAVAAGCAAISITAGVAATGAGAVLCAQGRLDCFDAGLDAVGAVSGGVGYGLGAGAKAAEGIADTATETSNGQRAAAAATSGWRHPVQKLGLYKGSVISGLKAKAWSGVSSGLEALSRAFDFAENGFDILALLCG